MADSKYSDDAILIYSSRCPHANRRRARECLACIEDVLDRVRAQSNPSPAAPRSDAAFAELVEAVRELKPSAGYPEYFYFPGPTQPRLDELLAAAARELEARKGAK